jgi:ABC-type transport system involved in Fe-S cluster assembly fused permease/ATPase subunit
MKRIEAGGDWSLFCPSVYCSINEGLIDAEKLSILLVKPTEVIDAPDAKELVVENGEVEFGACSTSSALFATYSP